jgi:hypothetical protein
MLTFMSQEPNADRGDQKLRERLKEFLAGHENRVEEESTIQHN